MFSPLRCPADLFPLLLLLLALCVASPNKPPFLLEPRTAPDIPRVYYSIKNNKEALTANPDSETNLAIIADDVRLAAMQCAADHLMGSNSRNTPTHINPVDLPGPWLMLLVRLPKENWRYVFIPLSSFIVPPRNILEAVRNAETVIYTMPTAGEYQLQMGFERITVGQHATFAPSYRYLSWLLRDLDYIREAAKKAQERMLSANNGIERPLDWPARISVELTAYTERFSPWRFDKSRFADEDSWRFPIP
ncbi:MAG: hypothetical protein M1829_006019 [Trizodia sp. TS-e1964]|nr:MAG: hypothetical protein M1829_006019 [Trizodia sp. TS-e1964]